MPRSTTSAKVAPHPSRHLGALMVVLWPTSTGYCQGGLRGWIIVAVVILSWVGMVSEGGWSSTHSAPRVVR